MRKNRNIEIGTNIAKPYFPDSPDRRVADCVDSIGYQTLGSVLSDLDPCRSKM